MGVLQRFERRLGGLVEGAFARAFGGFVQPVEIAAALTREAQDKKAIVGAGRVLVPNSYVVELGPADLERLSEYDAPLRAELAAMVSEAAGEQGWSFVGPVDVQLECIDALNTGIFRVRSSVNPGPEPSATPDSGHRTVDSAPSSPSGEGAHLVVLGHGPEASDVVRTIRLDREVMVLGRGTEADVQFTDTGISRRHAEVRPGPPAELLDLGSTNGTRVNGQRVDRSPLHDGDRIGVGTSELLFRTGEPEDGA